MANNVVKTKSYNFALSVIALYKALLAEREFVLSKQLLRSGTSIGANVEEALAGQSRKDFLAKMSIASKEAQETRYWLHLLRDSRITGINIDKNLDDADELVRLLTSIVKTTKERMRTIENSEFKT